MIEENEDHIATMSQCSQTEIPSDNDISPCTEEEEVKVKMDALKDCLSILLRRCLICTAPAIITKVITAGSALCINLLCQYHESIWRCQPMEKRFYLGNVRLSACLLFSSNNYIKLEKYLQILSIPWVSKSRYYDMLDHMLDRYERSLEERTVTNSFCIETKVSF